MADTDTENPCTGDADVACYCPLTELMDALSGKYALQLLCVLDAHDRLRFGDVESHFPTASTSTLSARLSELEDVGLVSREQFDEIPPRVEYDLTDDGREAARRLRPLVEWVTDRSRS